MPRVLFIVNRFNIGGVVPNVVILAKYLQPEFEILVIGGLPDNGEKDSLYMFEEKKIKVLMLEEFQRNIGIFNDWKSYKKIKSIIKDYRPDIVHTHAAKAGALGRIAAKKCKVPVIIHTYHGHVFHSYFGKVKTSLYKKIECWLAKKSNGIVAISEHQKVELSSIYHICAAEKIKVVEYGFELEKFGANYNENRIEIRKKYLVENEKVAIAMVGRLAPIKNNLYFLQAIEQVLKKENLPIKVFIVGNGSEWSAVEREAQRINAQYGDIVVLTSWIMDIAPFYAGMDIIALSSKNEGTPMCIIEAQASFVSVISTDVGGVKDIMQNGETGFAVPIENQQEYIEKLYLLIKNKEMRAKMSQNGHFFVQERFGYTTMIKNMGNYYRELLDKNV